MLKWDITFLRSKGHVLDCNKKSFGENYLRDGNDDDEKCWWKREDLMFVFFDLMDC
jgi:hypothetical protein